MNKPFPDDPHYPRYHFRPLRGWMNDPNGPILWNGTSHIFFQYNPEKADWGPMQWGHASSPDRIHWRHLPIALTPTPAGSDRDGCWTGSAVDDNGAPVIMYTGVNPQVQCIARSDDKLIEWTKDPRNPLIASPPYDINQSNFRDPCLWFDGKEWRVIIGTAIDGKGGAALLYGSKDLVAWEFMHPLCVGDRTQTGDMWECPDFFPLGGKHCLIVSTLGKCVYMIGEYRDDKFTSETMGDCDFGGNFYAEKSEANNPHQRILWAWSTEARDSAQYIAAGWAGCMSLPRVMTLRNDGIVEFEPVKEIARLRGRKYVVAAKTISEGLETLSDIEGDSLEIDVVLAQGAASQSGIAVRMSPAQEEITTITYDWASHTLRLDRHKSSLTPGVSLDVREAQLPLNQGEKLNLRVFLDHSIIEVFANKQVCFTSRIYPSRSDSLALGWMSAGGDTRLDSCTIWEMKEAEALS